MTPLKTENLDLTFNNNVAHITVKGAMAKDSLEAGLEWIDQVVEANDNFSIRVDMAKDDFADLSEISGEFKQVGRMLRHASLEENLGADKCAVLTDSMFLRNSAKVEGAVIPGLELNTFGLDADDVAEKWLRDQPLTQDKAPRETASNETAETIHASAGPAPTELTLVSPSEMKTIEAASTKREASESKNPWGDFRAI
ncbi:SpoIIAA family protein [Hellea balneolensis]|uniref:STAS/SEC14 domain-containing protein n=1 Tax=Hellea balneolensis TaxID=287478 RepID=UPI000427FC69|nr:STAS/SEC14 domain-containing protein [Hellea balneolensis]